MSTRLFECSTDILLLSRTSGHDQCGRLKPDTSHTHRVLDILLIIQSVTFRKSMYHFPIQRQRQPGLNFAQTTDDIILPDLSIGSTHRHDPIRFLTQDIGTRKRHEDPLRHVPGHALGVLKRYMTRFRYCLRIHHRSTTDTHRLSFAHPDYAQ